MTIPTLPKPIIRILRSEALVVAIIVITTYQQAKFAWLPLIIFVLLPDIFMIGYAKNSRLGARLYNIGHTYLLPFCLLISWFCFGRPNVLLMAALIWTLHIAFDRAMGYGLKFDSDFQHTHLGTIGRQRPPRG